MLLDMTQLSFDQLKTALFHLCKPKIRLLVKQSKGPKFEDKNELIKLNKNFRNVAKRIVLIPSLANKHMQAGNKKMMA